MIVLFWGSYLFSSYLIIGRSISIAVLNYSFFNVMLSRCLILATKLTSSYDGVLGVGVFCVWFLFGSGVIILFRNGKGLSAFN
jgi:hypothetical protein